MTKKEKEFLIGLSALTRKTGIKISGCGCCSSPFLCDAVVTDEDSGYSYESGSILDVMWVDKSDPYNWENYSDFIVKDV